MATQVNLIQNGGFTQVGSAGPSPSLPNYDANWGGTGHEAYATESSYITGGSTTDRVAEIDGTSGTTSTYTQSFNVTQPGTADLSFETALRSSKVGSVPQGEGVRVAITDSLGNTVFTQDVIPTTDTLQTMTYEVNFATADTYTITFSELGIDDGAGAIIDDVSLLICFAGGTRIAADFGVLIAENIESGDRLMTDNGVKDVRWVGKRHLSEADLEKYPHLRPIKVSRGALGKDLPHRDLWVSPHHRLVVRSAIAKRVFNEDAALVEAKKLVGLPGIYVDEDIKEITYVHVLFDTHEIVFAEGAPTESLFLGKFSKQALGGSALREIQEVFPELDIDIFTHEPALPIPELKKQADLSRRYLGKKRYLIEH